MKSLYPLKFNPILKNKIWGGDRLRMQLHKHSKPQDKVGESWELSGVEGDISEVTNGFLVENNIQELIEVYMGDLVGEKVYEQFGNEFPLLIKFIDANDYLSLQVHPDEEMANERHSSHGKTEMWYVLDAEKEAELIVGFNQEMDKEKLLDYFGSGRLRELLNYEKVTSGDVFFIPAGRIHATGPGILFAEIQQTSDLTYRIYDWDRMGDDGNPRQLHLELAIDAIDYEHHGAFKTPYSLEKNKSSKIVKCPYFTTNIISCDKPMDVDYHTLDSFVVYMMVEGEAIIKYDEEELEVTITKGEIVLIPAEINEIHLIPRSGTAKMLEVYIEME
jgi:mannose-6-phosphate isomerase